MRGLQQHRPALNQAWKEQLGDHRPARSAIESSDFARPSENARYLIGVTVYRG